MLKRIVEKHQDENFRGIENARKYAKDNTKINITAIEMSPDMITVGNEYIKKKKLESQVGFINGNIEDDMLLDKLDKFDFKIVFPFFMQNVTIWK